MNKLGKYAVHCAAFLTIFLGMMVANVCHAGYLFSEDPTVVGVDGFKFSMALKVPRIYDNNSSKGYRKYNAQKLEGEMYLIYRNGETPEVVITNLVNKTQKMSNGAKIEYRCTVDPDKVYPVVNYIGNNKTGKFNVGSIVFYLDADPNYNRGEDDPDNSLLVTIAGKSTTSKCYMSEWLGKVYKYLGWYYEYKTFSGNVAGTLGCGCYAYGHTSPTRIAGACGPTRMVSDVAAVWGSWKATHKATWSWRSCNFYEGCCGD